MRRIFSLGIFQIAFIAVLFGGCYTILVHPRLKTSDGDANQRISFDDNCLQCHSEADVQYFYHRAVLRGCSPYLSTEFPGSSFAEPYEYYNYPWWYGNTWTINRYTADRQQRDGVPGGSTGTDGGTSPSFVPRRSGMSRNSSTTTGTNSSQPSGESTRTSSQTQSDRSRSDQSNERSRSDESTDRSRESSSSSTQSTTPTRDRDISTPSSNSSNNSSGSSSRSSGSTRGRNH